MDLFPTPVLAAPMAGGAGTPALVAAAGGGFLAAGYLTVDALAAQIATARAAGGWFGVNVFAPGPMPVDGADLSRYAASLEADFAVYGLAPAVPSAAAVDDDSWRAKIDLLLTDPVPAVSFTFGVPPARTIAALCRAGTFVLQSVTSAAEADAAADAGVDALIVQSLSAGGHSATLDPARVPPAVPLPSLIASVREVVGLPLVAAGGLGTPAAVASAIHAGATAVMVGTALLLADEAGTSATHRAALTDPARTETVVTRAFTGRPARALRNTFTDRHGDAPLGYPHIHHLTAPLRRAAASAGDTDRVHLWAGTAFRSATAAPAAAITATLRSHL